MANVATRAMKRAMTTDLTASVTAGNYTGPLHSAKVGLFTNSFALSDETVYDDLIQSGHTDLAAKTITWGDLFSNPDGSYSIEGDLQQFQMTSAPAENVIHGAMVFVPGSPNVLMYAELFAETVTLKTVDDALLYAPNFTVGIGTDVGAGALVS